MWRKAIIEITLLTAFFSIFLLFTGCSSVSGPLEDRTIQREVPPDELNGNPSVPPANPADRNPAQH